MENQVIQPGESAGNYDGDWKESFDLFFLASWSVLLISLIAATALTRPELFSDGPFFLFALFKLVVMLLMSLAGGVVCRHYCRVDDKGYIITNKDSWFKVNYTRKLQHFAAYLVPLISGSRSGTAIHPYGILPHLWESLLVLLMFLLLIKPIRERSKFFMLQFNSLDRPEDRPNTLKWIVLGNIFPGLVLGTVFKTLFESINESGLVFIIVFIIGIGDGLAEPVGIYWGKKKYLAPSWGLKKRYVRSYAGSACVFLCGLLFTAIWGYEFNSVGRFAAAMAVIPAIMTVVEATAPHSMDTPTMMIIGYSTLYLIAI
jgi:dolichol kinase